MDSPRLLRPEGHRRLQGSPSQHLIRIGLEGYPPHAFCHGISGQQATRQDGRQDDAHAGLER